MENSPEEIKKSIKFQIGIAIGVFCMTIISVAIATVIDAPPPGNLFVGMGIAAFQTVLVGFYMMHLKSETKLIYKVLFFAGVFLAGMLVLTMLALRNGIPSRF